MPRKHSQGPEGYDIAIANLEGEYARAAGATSRTKAVYKGFLERIEWCLNVVRKEQREQTLARRSNGSKANGDVKTNGKATTRPDA